MCGRYTIYTDADERELLDILRIIEARGEDTMVVGGEIKYKTGEIFPTDRVPIMTRGDRGGMNVTLAEWGFSLRGKPPIINARRESAAQKQLFRVPLMSSRCIVPSTGFFEWSKSKEKYLFNHSDTRMVYMAGLWRVYEDKREFTIITADANGSVSPVHDRMPMVMRRDESMKRWLYDDEFAMSLCGFPLPDLISKRVS